MLTTSKSPGEQPAGLHHTSTIREKKLSRQVSQSRSRGLKSLPSDYEVHKKLPQYNESPTLVGLVLIAQLTRVLAASKPNGSVRLGVDCKRCTR